MNGAVLHQPALSPLKTLSVDKGKFFSATSLFCVSFFFLYRDQSSGFLFVFPFKKKLPFQVLLCLTGIEIISKPKWRHPASVAPGKPVTWRLPKAVRAF